MRCGVKWLAVVALVSGCIDGVDPGVGGVIPPWPHAPGTADPHAPKARGDLVLEARPDAAPRFVSRELEAAACEVSERCVQADGRRTLLTVPLAVRNLGSAPVSLRSGLFQPGGCGEGRALRGFFRAELRTLDGEKQLERLLSLPCASDSDAVEGEECTLALDQGASLTVPDDPCQVLDVTDLSAGSYVLRVTANARHQLRESDHGNNSLEWRLDYPGCAGAPCGQGCCPDGVACVDDVCLLPDLRVNRRAAGQALWLTEHTVADNACELDERCVTGTGRRRLLRFESRVENWGPGTLNVGPRENNPLFEYSSCRQRYLFKDFVDQSLRGLDGSMVVEGHKQSFCLFGMEPNWDAPPAPPGTAPPAAVTCNELPAGWSDVYGVDSPCQWIDVTDVPEGDYVLRVAVNPRGSILEAAPDDNVAKVPLHLPRDTPQGCAPRPEFCGDAEDQDCDDTPDAWDPDCWSGCALDDEQCVETVPAAGNELCPNAHELLAQGTYASSISAQAATAAPDACGAGGGAVYYRFTLPAPRIVYLSSLRSDFDSVLSLHPGDCDQAPLRCADDGCGTLNDHFAQRLEAGSYVVAVRAKRPGEGGQVRLGFVTAHPGGARVLDAPGSLEGDTRAADDNLDVCQPRAEFVPEQVFAFASCGGVVQASASGRGRFEPMLALRANGIEGTPLACSAASGAAPAEARIESSVPRGLTFLAIEARGSGEDGRYRLSLSF
jgi:Lysyl oxidase